MAIYYAQILGRESRKILSGTYSAAGTPLEKERGLLFELRELSQRRAEEDRLYVHESKSGRHQLSAASRRGYLACVVTEARASPKEVSAFVEAAAGAFARRYGDTQDAHYEFDTELRRVCDEHNKRVMMGRSADELEGAYNILVENLDGLRSRTEILENLKSLSEKVNSETREMSRKVSQIRRNARLEKYKVYAVIALVLLVLFYLFFM